MDDLENGVLTYPELAGESKQRPPFNRQFADPHDIGLRQLVGRSEDPSVFRSRARSVAESIFPGGVMHVVGLSPQPEVVGANAGWVVAVMENR